MSTSTIRAGDDPGQDAGPFLQAFDGQFTATLRWPQFDALWARLRDDAAGGWYAYAVGEPPPAAPLAAADLEALLGELEGLLRREHQEDYCGIVYADHLQSPSFVKIYDPNNLGSVCGSSGVRTLPGWILSKLPPVDLQAITPPAGRRRWWRRFIRA
ncbi:MAG: hypothetical protein U5S82_02760 [Gammaproteobacteria bacterium]|nr:hypothetical protein [Gammaproteobacteria bacterium]